jgi:hypothetical protein
MPMASAQLPPVIANLRQAVQRVLSYLMSSTPFLNTAILEVLKAFGCADSDETGARHNFRE